MSLGRDLTVDEIRLCGGVASAMQSQPGPIVAECHSMNIRGLEVRSLQQAGWKVFSFTRLLVDIRKSMQRKWSFQDDHPYMKDAATWAPSAAFTPDFVAPHGTEGVRSLFKLLGLSYTPKDFVCE